MCGAMGVCFVGDGGGGKVGATLWTGIARSAARGWRLGAGFKLIKR